MTWQAWSPGLLTLAILALYAVVLLWGVRRGVRSLRAEMIAQTRLILANQEAQATRLLRRLPVENRPPAEVPSAHAQP